MTALSVFKLKSGFGHLSIYCISAVYLIFLIFNISNISNCEPGRIWPRMKHPCSYTTIHEASLDINVSCSHCNRICSFEKDNTRLYVCSSFLTQVWWLMALVLKTLPENNPSLSEEWKSLSSSYNSRVVGTLVKPLGAIQYWQKLIGLVFKHILWLYHASYNAAHWHKTRPTIHAVLPTGYQSKPYHFNDSTYVRLYCQLLASHFQSHS